jgi:two-component system, NarL family, response regulator DevR
MIDPLAWRSITPQDWGMHGDVPDRPAVRILLVDDHEIVREGLAAVLARQSGFDVVGQADTAAKALEAFEQLDPELIVLDIGLPDMSGIELCREIKARRAETRVVMLTGSDEEDNVLSAVIAGANGYLLKQSGIRDVVRAIGIVAEGGSLLDPAATDRVAKRIRHLGSTTEADPLASLTPREHRVLTLVAAGKTNKQIAAEAQLSEKTVKRSVTSILSKLNLERRTQAAAVFVDRRRSQ